VPDTAYAPFYVSPYWGYTFNPYGVHLHGAGSVLYGAGNYLHGAADVIRARGADVIAAEGQYLHGAADVIRSEGQFMINQQQAFLMREEYRKRRLERRRLELQQWLWERENLPTVEDERERTREEQRRRSLNPPITEIWSAKSLNDLLQDLIKVRSPGSSAGRT